MLGGSVVEFKDKFDSFVYELKLHMLNLANGELLDSSHNLKR
jgi:hypothetical protein